MNSLLKIPNSISEKCATSSSAAQNKIRWYKINYNIETQLNVDNLELAEPDRMMIIT